MNALIVMREHRINHFTIPARLNNIEKRMQSAVCIPQRKGRVIGVIFRLMNILVETFILAVRVHINRRRQKCVIHRRIKIDEIVFIFSRHGDFPEFFVPRVLPSFFYFFKIPTGRLRF